MLFGVTAALIDVNAAQLKLVLLENFNENYSKCLRLLVKLQLREITIRELSKKIDIVQKEKNGIQLNVDKFEHVSKSLNKLIECQIVKNYKKGLGYENYNSVSPPYTGNFMPPTPDLSFTGLDEFVNEPVVENCKAMSSEEEPRGNPQIDLQDQRVIDSGCLRHMTWNMSYLIDYEEIDGGYVAFGGNPKGGKIIGKDRTPTLSFMRPFGCPVTILNTIDHLGKFDGKADEGFFVGYSLNSKAFRVFNSRTRIVEENLHIRFSESTPNVVGSGPDWLFDIDALTRIMNYEPIVAGKARKETEPVKDYILLPLWTANPPYSQDLKSSHDDGSKPSSDDGKKVDEDPRKDSECNDQEKEDNVNSTNNVNAAGTNKVNVVGGKTSIELPFDPNMPALEDYSIFDLSRDDEDDGAEADMNNLDTTIQVSPIPTTRIHKDHPLDQVIEDLQSATQTRKMSKNLKEHGFVSTIQQRTNHKDLQNCLFACFLSQEEPKKVFRNKRDERGIMVRNKARLVAQGYTQEVEIDYDEVFAPVARIEAIRLFLAYVPFKDFVVYQMDVKSTFLYEKIEEEVYVCQLPGFEDSDFPDRVYKVEKALYGLHQAPRAWYETLSTYVAFCLLEDLTAFCFKTSLRFASRPHCVLLQDLTAFCFKTSLRFASSYHCVLLQHHCVFVSRLPFAFCLKDHIAWERKNGIYKHSMQILQSIDQGPFELGTTRDALGTTPEGGVLLGPERPRTYEDLSDTEKKRYDADVRATNIVLQGLPKDIYKLHSQL
ncbi:putative ribonuclease H-like domain-containing protein [Tanacetum coccineum]